MEMLLQRTRSPAVRAQVIRYFSVRRANNYRNLDYRRFSCLRYKQIYTDKQTAWLPNRHGVPIPPCSASVLCIRDFCDGPAFDRRNKKDNELCLQTGPLLCILRQPQRQFSLTSARNVAADGEKSKVEQTVKALKESTTEVAKTALAAKKSILTRIVDEILHYYHGFRLLFIDMRISMVLGFRLLRGKSLTRREHRLLTRTMADLFRLLPFSVFIFVPFMELTLPIAIKLFPNMLPSTFQTKDEKMAKLKTQLKVKLEVAKFLQDTLDEMSLQTSGEKNSVAAQQFKEFFTKIRSSGQNPPLEEILKFSKLFADDLTLDNLPRGSLVALCKLLELHSIGPTSFLTFQLRMALRSLKTDDMMIQKEGLDTMTVWELQQASKARGMRAVGIPESQMKDQLNSWLDLSLKQNIPPSLLLLTRAMSLTDAVPAADQIAAAISQLPESIGTQAEAKVLEMEGKVDNKIRIQLLKEEQKKIAEERVEQERLAKEEVVDKAGVIGDGVTATDTKEGIDQKDIVQIENALDTISANKKKLILEKEELQDLKQEMAEYKEDMEELKDVKEQLGVGDKQYRESKGAARLSNQINKMITKLDETIETVEKDKVIIPEQVTAGEPKKEQLVSISELVTALRTMQKTPDEAKIRKIEDVLTRMDIDHDGNIKVDEVVKVFEVLGHEQGNITPKQMKEIVELFEKEENLDMVEKMEKMMPEDKR